LRECPHLHLLVTSRERLGLAGETRWPVRPLSTRDDATLSVEEALECDAVRFFDSCARAIVPSFVLSAANVGSVLKICARLDGLPLAIELAASRLVNLSPQEIADRLSDRFALLAGARQGVPPYHQGLRSAVDRSYGLLSRDERLVFARLSVFAGAFTLNEAEAACADVEIAPTDILNLASQLVDKSMIDVEPAADGGILYRLPETLREYGRARLADIPSIELSPRILPER
jgi:non-specific serine/threonine protein kinase